MWVQDDSYPIRFEVTSEIVRIAKILRSSGGKARLGDEAADGQEEGG